MSGDLNSAKKRKADKKLEICDGQSKASAASQNASSSNAIGGTSQLTVEGLSAEYAHIAGIGNYYNRSQNKGDPEILEKLKSVDNKPGDRKVKFSHCKFRGTPLVGETNSYIVESTTDQSPGASNRNDSPQRTNLTTYLSRVLNTLPPERIEKLAKELEDTFEIFAAPDDLLEVDMEKLKGLQTIKMTQKDKFLRHVQELRSKPPAH